MIFSYNFCNFGKVSAARICCEMNKTSLPTVKSIRTTHMQDAE